MDENEAAEVLRRVGLAIKVERARRDMTQEVLAERSGLSVGQISRMERGGRDAGVTTLVSVAWALAIHPAVLMQGLHQEELRERH